MREIAPYVNIHTHRSEPSQQEITTIGIHPYDADKGSFDMHEVESADVDAIGEIGLDYSIDVDRDLQESIFSMQLEIAQRRELPVVIHCVRAFEPIFKILDEYKLSSVIFHGFIGSYEQASKAISRNYYLSFGHRCFTSSKTLNVLRKIHINNLFLETDAEQISIEEIYKLASQYREENVDELRDKIYKNYINLFPNDGVARENGTAIR